MEGDQHGQYGEWRWPGVRANGGRTWRKFPLFLPVVVAAVQLTGARVAEAHQGGGVDLPALAYGLLLLGPAALVLRRVAPLASLVAALAATATYLALDLPRGPVILSAVVAIFAATYRARRPTVWLLCGLAYAWFVTVTLVADRLGGVVVMRQPIGGYLGLAVATAVVVMLAEGARIRTEHLSEMGRSRAEAARARQEQTRRQASDERLQIARELHDVLGHHLSLINVRSGVALHLLDARSDSSPEVREARDALDAIKHASAEALGEVRGVLAALHPGDESGLRSPAPGLSDVERLAREASAAGLPVTVRRQGSAQPIPSDVDRAAYRIVQEALTNVRRHAGPTASVTVSIAAGPTALTVQVDDTGTGPVATQTDGVGNGIPGMRERASALGGRLQAGPGPSGGFRVEATLPTVRGNAPRAPTPYGQPDNIGRAGVQPSNLEQGAPASRRCNEETT